MGPFKMRRRTEKSVIVTIVLLRNGLFALLTDQSPKLISCPVSASFVPCGVSSSVALSPFLFSPPPSSACPMCPLFASFCSSSSVGGISFGVRIISTGRGERCGLSTTFFVFGRSAEDELRPESKVSRLEPSPLPETLRA